MGVDDAAILWHELGHAIDNFYRMDGKWFSVDAELAKAVGATKKLPLEWRRYITKKANEAFNIVGMDRRSFKTASEFTKNARREIQKQMKHNEAFSGVAGLSDIYDAITKGANYKWLKYYGAHGAKYFSRSGEAEKEIFANYFQLRIFNRTEELEILEKTHPDLYNKLSKVFDEATSALRGGKR